MTSNEDHDTAIPDTSNHDADGDPIAGLLDRLGGDAALVRRAAFIRIRATAAPVDGATLAAECDLTLHEVEAALKIRVAGHHGDHRCVSLQQGRAACYRRA